MNKREIANNLAEYVVRNNNSYIIFDHLYQAFLNRPEFAESVAARYNYTVNDFTNKNFIKIKDNC